jgi:hypothetical protein
MSTALATKPANVLRNYTAQVRDHASAMQRLQDQYFAALKRAEAQYFDGVKRITESVVQDTKPEAPPAPGNGGQEKPQEPAN